MKKLNDKEMAILRRAVNNFNAKVTRLEKAGNTNFDKVKIKDIKENIFKASDVKREVNKLKRFTRRGAELESEIKGISNYELNEAKINIRIEKAKITRERKKLLETPFSAGGVATGYSIGNIKPLNIQELDSAYNRLNNFFKSKEGYEIKQNIKNLAYRTLKSTQYKRESNFKENYLYALQEAYRNYEGFEKIWEKLEKMTPKELYNLAIRDDMLLDFINFYEDDVYKSEQVFKKFIRTWNKTIRENGK